MAKVRRVFISFQHEDLGKAKGLNLMTHAPNVELKFSGRHLINPVKSTDDAYIRRSIREQITGSSVTVLLVGAKTAESRWIAEEIKLSQEKSPPNRFVVIRLEAGAVVPDGTPDDAERLDWFKPDDVAEFGPAIERAAAAREQAVKIAETTPGGGSDCGR